LNDLTMFVSGFNKQGSQLGDVGELVLFNADGGLTMVGAVPEPATLGLMALGLAAMAARRRRAK